MWRKMSSDWPVYIIFATLLVVILVKSFTSDDSKVQSALVNRLIHCGMAPA